MREKQNPPDGLKVISVVIPVMNEEPNIGPLVDRLVKTLTEITASYEIVLVDDGSGDNTVTAALEKAKANPNITLIELSRNFGQHAAIQVGLDNCKGLVVALMDADLQETPEDLPKLLEKYHEGYDLVYGMKNVREDSISKKLASLFFTFVFNSIGYTKLPANATTMRVMSRRFVDSLNSFPERVRFIAGISSWVGFRRTGVEVRYVDRVRGESKYGLFKLVKLTLDGILSFSTFPLRLVTVFGVVISVLSACIILYMIGRWYVYGDVLSGWTSIIVSIFMMTGIQSVFMGIIGEYIARIYLETKHRPVYIIKDIKGGDISG